MRLSIITRPYLLLSRDCFVVSHQKRSFSCFSSSLFATKSQEHKPPVQQNVQGNSNNNIVGNNLKHKPAAAAAAASTSTDWVRIYRFPLIVPLRGFSRFKIWQTIAAFGLTPFVLSAYQTGALSAEFAAGSLVGSALATVTLYALSYFSRNLIGIVSVNPRDDTIRVGRLTFWGRRVDDIFPKSDIVPIGDVGENPRDIWWRVYRYSRPNNPYFIVLRFGGVDQPDLFRSLFGSFRG